MSFKDDFNLFLGAKFGIIKGVKAMEGHQPIVKSIQSLNHLSKETDVTALAWSDKDEEEILIGLSNQVVKTYDTNFKSFVFSTNAQIDGSQGNICGLSRFDGALVTAVESGHVRVLRYKAHECIKINAEGPISRMRHSKTHQNTIGTGGLENELKLWDLETGKRTFEAKNVPHDFLDLRVPVWVTDHAFLPNSDKVAVGSKYGYVRLYDPKAQRRPVIKVDMPEKAVTCMTSCSQDHLVLCGLSKGDIVAVDMRMGRASYNYKGFLGGVRDIACHPSEPYVVSVGLDRFLRVHHLTSKQLLLKEYLVSRMNCVLMRSNFTLKAPEYNTVKKSDKSNKLLCNDLSDLNESKQMDEIFESMDQVMVGAKNTLKRSIVDKRADTPSKKKKQAGLLVNPFAAKTAESKSVNGRVPSKKSPIKKDTGSSDKCEEDSDDDIMIVSESVCNQNKEVCVGQGEYEESEEHDEAAGDSDEFDSENDSPEDSIDDAHADIDPPEEYESDEHNTPETKKTRVKAKPVKSNSITNKSKS